MSTKSSNERPAVLVAIDVGPESERAFTAALDLAAKLSAPIEIAHVVPPVPVSMTSDPPYVAAAQEQLELWADRARARGIDTRIFLLTDAVVFALLDLIEERKPLFVVVGSHGRKGLARVLLGSVSEALARRSTAPVLIVPAERRDKAVPVAWSCEACGHIYAEGEPSYGCVSCGASPARWITAPIEAGATDSGEPAVGESVAPDLVETQTRSSVGGFATSPPGCNGTDVNPELRIRY